MEKIHGTSSHVEWTGNQLKFFSGGESHEKFVSLFNAEFLVGKFQEVFGTSPITVYGEAYGGKCQGMSHTYGKELKFVAFDVWVGGDKGCWLNVPKAQDVVNKLNLEFVHYVKCSTDIIELDKQRDADSEQAIRNGIGLGKIREGVVIRPLEEFRLNNSSRVICKHKRDEFRETKTPRPIVSPEKLKLFEDAERAADEFVTAQRLNHILSKIPNHSIEQMGLIIKSMQEDVLREGEKEVINNDETRKAIGKKTVLLYKEMLKNSLKSS